MKNLLATMFILVGTVFGSTGAGIFVNSDGDYGYTAGALVGLAIYGLFSLGDLVCDFLVGVFKFARHKLNNRN